MSSVPAARAAYCERNGGNSKAFEGVALERSCVADGDNERKVHVKHIENEIKKTLDNPSVSAKDSVEALR